MIISLQREIFFAYMILFSKFSIDILSRKRDTVFTTNGEGEYGAATARRKLKPDGGHQPGGMEAQ